MPCPGWVVPCVEVAQAAVRSAGCQTVALVMGLNCPTQAVSVSLMQLLEGGNSSSLTPNATRAYTGVLDGAHDAAPLGAGGTEPAMGVAEADLGLAFCRGGAGGG